MDILGTLDVTKSQLAERMKQLVVLELYRERQISSGKAAELLGMTKYQFIQLAAQHDVPYFDANPDELAEEVNRTLKLVRERLS